MRDVEELHKIVEERLGVAKEVLVSKRRTREVVNARRVFSVILYKNSELTVEKVGEIVGVDHATISHYKNTMKWIFKTEKSLKEDYEYIDMKFKVATRYDNLKDRLEFLSDERNRIDEEIEKINQAIDFVDEPDTALVQ